MVLFTISKQITHIMGSAMFRTGLSLRNVLAMAVAPRAGDTPYLDLWCGIPYSQKLLSLSVYDESARVVTKHKEASSVEKALDATYDALFGGAPPSAAEIAESQRSIAELRLGVLDEHLRPALLPNEQWGDVLQWMWNPRIMKWARQEFLVAKYGPRVKEALDAYPQLRSSPQFSRHPTQRMLANIARGRLDLKPLSSSSSTSKGNKIANPRTLLPSSDTLVKAFEMYDWAKKKDTKKLRQSMDTIAQRLGGHAIKLDDGTVVGHAQLSIETDLRTVSLEDILEVAGGHVGHCGPFNTVCEEADIYQLWTKDYIQHLGDYLLDRTKSHFASKGGETIVLDVGAGDGLLVHFLREHAERKDRGEGVRSRGKASKKTQHFDIPTPTFVATDNGSQGIFAKAEVERLDVKTAISKYCAGAPSNNTQVIVLCSWMPIGQDWSKLFRDAAVEEYILIGEADDGSSGLEWETWGNAESWREKPEGETVPPYVREGYKRWDMNALTPFQFSRYDCAVSRGSATVSFRRTNETSS
eukprot:Nitzschia sp. Nitz4//scaffold279_size24496//16175//17824//NITZ4_008383-RA/size24496-augustus-gene-0.8-mRNA-1//1//CDS//3329545400//433//frame0